VTRPLFDERKCVVCRCTDEMGCAEGCEWSCLAPPVCSSCVAKFVLARLWASLFTVKSSLKGGKAREVDQLMQFYGSFTRVQAERHGIPTPGEVRRINRNVARWIQKNPPVRKQRKGAQQR
jgi:hypothetical protein